jgi:cell division protein FtsQ
VTTPDDDTRDSARPGGAESGEPGANPVVQIGDVSDEVKAELERLFGSTRPAAPAPANDTTAESKVGETPLDDTEPSAEVPNAIGGATLAVGSATGGVTASSNDSGERPVLAIGDPGLDSVAPLPVDPLLAARDGVVQIIDDSAQPDVRDAADVSRVLIIDDEAPVNRAEDRERRRKRRRRLRQIKWVRITMVAAGSVVAVAAILASPLFAIRSVAFEGVVYTSDATVSKVRSRLDGASVFSVDTAAARQLMLDDPWVEEVRITTTWRGRATVEVAERTPVVWYVGDDQKARIVDARGHVIAVLDGWPTKYLQVRGTGPSLDAGAVADSAYRAAAQLVLALPEEISSVVTALELSRGGELSMLLDGGTVVRFGPPEGLQDKLVAVVVLLRRQDPATLAVVDVSTGEPAVQTR